MQRRHPRAFSPLSALVVAMALLLVAACGTTAPRELASRDGTSVSDPGTTVPSSDVPDSTLGVIRQAYAEITRALFREVAPESLLGAAWTSVSADARRQGAAFDIGPFREAGSATIDGFVQEFERYAAALPEGLDRDRLAHAAVRGMAAAVGDSHTRYLTPDQVQSSERAIAGDESYVGIGVRIDGFSDGVTIAEVYPAGPADLAGIRPGDRILRVDGRDVAGAASGDVSARVRGSEGAGVALTVQRAGEEPRDVTVVRARVTPPTVSSRLLETGIGYLHVASFPRRNNSVDAARDVDRQLAALIDMGARGIILDLRGNPGGDPFTSANIASNFVAGGPIFVSINRDGKRTVYPATTRSTAFHGPVAVLVDRGTASGGEVVASALQEYGAGYVIGARTCGCLSVGRPARLDDGTGLIVTVEQAVTGRYERSLEGVGLQPDELVRGSVGGTTDAARDRAVAYLRERLP